MKRITTILAAFAAVLAFTVSCQEKNDPQTAVSGADEPCTVTLDLGGYIVAGTRADSPSSSEKVLNSLQLFIWKADGITLEYAKSLTSDEIKAQKVVASITTGSKTAYVVANKTLDVSKENPMTLENFGKLTLSLGDNTMNEFVMAGSSTFDAQDGGTYDVTIKRLVAKVIMKQISRKMEDATQAGISIAVNQVYMSNLPAKVRMDGAAVLSDSGDDWYTKMGRWSSLSALDALTSKTYSSPVAIADGDVYTEPQYFYVLPNNATQTFAESWSVRPTRMVVACTVASKNTRYYPVSVLNIERNKIYEVALQMVSTGSTDPDDPSKKEEGLDIDVNVTVTVADWEPEVVTVSESI